MAADAATDNSAFVDNASRTEDGAGALMDEMRGCRSMQDIVEVIQDEAANMSPPEVSLALYRIGYLSSRASKTGMATTCNCYMSSVRCGAQLECSCCS